MKKTAIFLGLLFAAFTVHAAVTVGTSPTSLVTTATSVPVSTEKAVFEFALTADAAETLSTVTVLVNSATASSSDFAAVTVYKDDGDGTFEEAQDMVAGTQTTVNVGSNTVVTTASNNTLTGAKFFVVLETSGTWSVSDSVTVTLITNGLATSANSPSTSSVTTAAITGPDVTGPVLLNAVVTNKVGGTSALDSGDTVVLTFGEATNKPAITAANIATTLSLNNSHSWLDGVASIGGASWNEAGTVLTVTLSTGTSIPTLVVGDTVTVSGSIIKDSSNNNATGSVALTGSFGTTDSTGPALSAAVAANKDGGVVEKEAGDKVVLTFGEATNKPTINASNIDDVLVLNNSHSWLDGADAIGSASWNGAGTVLTVVISAGTSLPTVAVGDTVTITGSTIKDATGNNATGTKTITGGFGTAYSGEDEFGKTCSAGGIINGKLYKVAGSETVYLAAGCRLKPFRGAAVFHARGHKFQNIITLSSLTGIEVSTKPALPAGGTLVKGTAKTVWFVTEDGQVKGFVSEKAFKRLGFVFGSVKQISDTDLAELTPSANISETDGHPEGAVLKCTTSQTVYMMKGNQKMAFTKPQPYLDRGHTWDAIAVVDCSLFPYQSGSNIEQ